MFAIHNSVKYREFEECSSSLQGENCCQGKEMLIFSSPCTKGHFQGKFLDILKASYISFKMRSPNGCSIFQVWSDQALIQIEQSTRGRMWAKVAIDQSHNFSGFHTYT